MDGFDPGQNGGDQIGVVRWCHGEGVYFSVGNFAPKGTWITVAPFTCSSMVCRMPTKMGLRCPSGRFATHVTITPNAAATISWGVHWFCDATRQKSCASWSALLATNADAWSFAASSGVMCPFIAI